VFPYHQGKSLGTEWYLAYQTSLRMPAWLAERQAGYPAALDNFAGTVKRELGSALPYNSFTSGDDKLYHRIDLEVARIRSVKEK
jgi:hypothetical protein